MTGVISAPSSPRSTLALRLAICGAAVSQSAAQRALGESEKRRVAHLLRHDVFQSLDDCVLVQSIGVVPPAA